MVRASIAWAPESALCRASCSWIEESRCHSITLAAVATMAISVAATAIGRANGSRGAGDRAGG